MRYKLTLTLIFSIMALVLPTAVVKPSSAPTAPVIKPGPPPTAPVVSVAGECIAGQKLLCIADVTGGTPPYTYEWGPAPGITGSGQMKIVPCSGTGTRIISVTVTDANGEVGYFSSPFRCCGGINPQ
jgi:hypothetical protein